MTQKFSLTSLLALTVLLAIPQTAKADTCDKKCFINSMTKILNAYSANGVFIGKTKRALPYLFFVDRKYFPITLTDPNICPHPNDPKCPSNSRIVIKNPGCYMMWSKDNPNGPLYEVAMVCPSEKETAPAQKKKAK